MGLVAANLAAMEMGQLFLSLIFLASYALALGRFVGAHTRLVVICVALCAAVSFVGLSHPWEAGVILLAWAMIGMALFAGAAWILWKVTADQIEPAAEVDAPVQHPAMALYLKDSSPADRPGLSTGF